MKKLESKTGKEKGPHKGRPPKTKVSELTKHDQDLYQEIMEDVLRDHGIKPNIIIEKIKDKKKKGKKPKSVKDFASVTKTNRTSYYYQYKPKSKNQQSKIERLWVPGLIENMCQIIYMSDGSIGRDKLYNVLYDNGFRVSSYVFRIHYEAIAYKSLAYIRKGNKSPKEEKSKVVWTQDYVQGKFISSYPGEVVHADIKYIKINSQWWYLHVMLETYANKVLAWNLTKTRNAISTIKLAKKAFQNLNYHPRIFHSDHGIEYANESFRLFLNDNGIIQSMSPKGNSLANRPSEYLFGLIQREKLDRYEINNLNYSQVHKIIYDYFEYYNIHRVQSNLQYKTPQAIFQAYGVCV